MEASTDLNGFEAKKLLVGLVDQVSKIVEYLVLLLKFMKHLI